MYRSDNAAANLLMARRGEPSRLTAYLRTIGESESRVDSYEGNTENRPATFDTTTPQSIVETNQRLLLGRALPADAKAQLERWLAGNVVGKQRLRASFPAVWQAGDRTGTGDGSCKRLRFRATSRPSAPDDERLLCCTGSEFGKPRDGPSVRRQGSGALAEPLNGAVMLFRSLGRCLPDSVAG